MKLKLSEPGVVVSGGVHVLALLLLILSFAKPQQFDQMQETVPIETISDKEFNQVMRGEKTASAVHPESLPKADKVDPAPETKPTPPVPDQPKAPPPPPPPTPEPIKQEPPSPPERPAQQPPAVAQQTPTPPPPPTPPVRPAPAPTVPTPPERVDADAEPIAQAKPVPVPPQPPRPPERVADAKPMPPVKPHVAPKPPKLPKPDQLAKLLDTDTPDQPTEKPTPRTPTRTRAEAQPDSHTFDLTDISRLLSHDAPAQRPATGREQSKLASLGSPTAHAEKMAPSLWGQLDGLMEEQYRQCWSYLGLSAGQKYVPQIRVMYDESGGLTADPVLVNPPTDPNLRSLAESALRAVRRCNPLRIPPQYAPYYDEWKGRVLRFDPQEMAG